jgi:SAM-dependent methyltransferase
LELTRLLHAYTVSRGPKSGPPFAISALRRAFWVLRTRASSPGRADRPTHTQRRHSGFANAAVHRIIGGMTPLSELQDPLAAAEALMAAGRAEQAQQLCERVLAAYPDQPKALMILSVVRIMQSDLAAAEALLLRGCAVHSQVLAFQAALAQLRLQTQRFGEALEPLENCVLLEPANRDHRVALMNVYQARLFTGFSERSKRAMLACLSDDALSHWLIQRQWLGLLKLDPACAPRLELLSVPDYASFAARMSAEHLAAWQDDEFLNAGLKRFLVADFELERGFGFARRWLFEHPAEAERSLSLLCTLARYFFLTEYLLPASEDLASLRAAPASAAQAALLGCYEPLLGCQAAVDLAAFSELACYRELLEIQVTEPLQELAIREDIDALCPIADEVSLAVRDQYEQNPYPRWSSVGAVARSNPEVQAQARGRRILIAGCGTGREALEAALVFPAAELKAIDLSRASLSYAIRKARELGTPNVSFHQADLLELPKLPQRFDFIICSGVLHHLREPLDGLRALVESLAPGGVVRLAVYSTIGRRAISEARAWAKRERFAATRTGIQNFRAALMARDDSDPLKKRLASSYDFYSLSQCRDLVFHVQEHTFTCLEIRDLLLDCGLGLLRVDTKSPAHTQAYRQRFPDDREGLRLQHWHEFEMGHPTMFAGLYSFWLCRESERSNADLSWIDSTRRFA